VKSDSAPGKARIDSLTGLRTLAAAWVVIFHFKDEITKFFPHLPSPLFHFVNTGWLGVDVFFVLSGFVISYNYATTFATFNAPTYWRYLWLRLARIYPLHLAVLAAYGVLLGLASLGFGNINNPDDFSISSLLTYLLLIQAWYRRLEQTRLVDHRRMVRLLDLPDHPVPDGTAEHHGIAGLLGARLDHCSTGGRECDRDGRTLHQPDQDHL
jgi:peptidoglycan/LPS O-acetylase OafA/YrhL